MNTINNNNNNIRIEHLSTKSCKVYDYTPIQTHIPIINYNVRKFIMHYVSMNINNNIMGMGSNNNSMLYALILSKKVFKTTKRGIFVYFMLSSKNELSMNFFKLVDKGVDSRVGKVYKLLVLCGMLFIKMEKEGKNK